MATNISYLHLDGAQVHELALSHEDDTYLAVEWRYVQSEVSEGIFVMLSDPPPATAVIEEREGRFHFATWRKFTESHRADFDRTHRSGLRV